jgi:hypothetical protein
MLLLVLLAPRQSHIRQLYPANQLEAGLSQRGLLLKTLAIFFCD